MDYFSSWIQTRLKLRGVFVKGKMCYDIGIDIDVKKGLTGNDMNENTQKLTFGALLVAVFGVLLLLNRQTGGMLEETFIFLFPIPMVAFSARYGWKDSLPVFVCTVLISVFCGIFSSAFYAVTQSFIGLVYGSCLHARRDRNRTMLLVMALSALSNLLSSIVLASLFGIDLQEDITLMQTAMTEALEKVGIAASSAQGQAVALLLKEDALMRMFIVSMLFMGVMQGFIVCQLSVLILRRLRFPIEKPAPLTAFYPPRLTGYLAMILLMGYSTTLALPQTTGRQEVLRVLLQTGGLCAYMYLICFGFVAALFLLRAYGPGSRALNVILALLLFFVMPPAYIVLGFLYISTFFHDWVVEKMTARIRADARRTPR